MKPDFAARKRTFAGRALALLLLFTAALAGPASGQGFDSSKTPVTPVPADRHGDLKPAFILGDSSGWNFGSTPGPNNLFFYDVDAEAGYVFATTGRGLQMWRQAVEGSPDTAPELMAKVFAPPVVPDWHQSDLKFYLHGIDAPDGDASVVAVASVFNNGMLIWKADDSPDGKKLLSLKYQDSEKTGSQVWSTKIGGVSYAFFAATNSKVLVYNLDAAKSIVGTCLEVTPANNCSGVYKGKVNTQTGVSYLGGTGSFLVVSQGFLGVEVWNVANPALPQKVLQAAPPGITRGVALWKDGSSYYLAAVGTTAPALRIYDVTCITSANCPSSFGNPLASYDVHSSSAFVTASKKGSGTPFLYVGGEDQFTGGAQREVLLDVSNPAAPLDVTPHVHPDGYWGWYYYGNPTGFNWIMPRTAKFHGNFLYRAAYGLMDAHKFTGGGPPVANFDWSPATVYAGDPVTFNDRSTGGPDAWAWTFAGGTPASSTVKSPAGVSFATTGVKDVTLQISKGGSPQDSESKQVTVLDPMPQLASVSFTPPNPVVCQPITFKAEGVTGKPPLAYAWTLDSTQQTGQSADTFTWTPAQNEAGTHVAAVTVSGQGTDVDSASVDVGGLQPLVTPYTPTNDPFTAGTVKLHANQPGSVVWWSWDFDDDMNPGIATWTAWTNDPVSGPNPSHTYTTKGIRTVRVRVSQSCTAPDDANAVLSLALAIDITNPIPLVAEFTAQCPLGFCAFTIGESIPFTDSSTGADFYDYSWDGDDTFEDADHATPVGSHAYSAQGDFRPKLRVRRGAGESNVFQLAQTLRVRPGGGGGGPGGGNTPKLSITGPSTGGVGASLTFNASASNCTPSASGWSWNAGGGALSGSGSQVTISWASPGAKVISVTNSGCGSNSVNKTVTITGSEALKAEFTWSPVGAKEGQLVSFDGTLSTGSPTSYNWTFGDGGGGSGSKVTHTFATAGPYAVTLSVTRPGSCPPAPFCESSVQKTVVIAADGPLAAFTSSHCVSELGIFVCRAEIGQVVSFTDASTGKVTSQTWDFGDGTPTASGATATHVFKHKGTVPVKLTVSDGSRSSTFAKNFFITGKETSSIVLPWIAQSRGVLNQSSDLYVHNPGSEPVEVTFQFRKRGVPETDPPTAKRTLEPGATLFVADALSDLFQRENVAGLITMTVEDAVEPIITSFNTTFQPDGSEFGQTVPGVSLTKLGAAARASETQVQQLVGLNDNQERLAYFGVSNPNDASATFRLRFFDSQGAQIGPLSEEFTISRFGQRQFQVKEIRERFGIVDRSDYRVEVETTDGGTVVPYASNLRLASDDPSFIIAAPIPGGKTYLVGALSQPGLNDSTWVSDVLLSNPDANALSVSLTFTNVGFNSEPTSPVVIDLQPGETRRLADAIGGSWGITAGVGVVTILPQSSADSLVVQGESYDNTDPTRRFGQTMDAFTDADAAGQGESHYLVGLRQDDHYRTTFWLFNPGDTPAEYDVIYLDLDGNEIERLAAVGLGAGKARQLSPGQHPLPAEGVPGGFTVRILVKTGKVLAGAQVINNLTNDPAYVGGDTR